MTEGEGEIFIPVVPLVYSFCPMLPQLELLGDVLTKLKAQQAP